MQFSNNTRKSNVLKIFKYILKIAFPIIVIFVIIYFVGRIDMPAPNKLIKKEIPNEELTTLK
jgi:Na+/H+ antiporter NhaC